jgi:hypothetical protein
MLQQLVDEYVQNLATATGTANRTEPVGVIEAFRAALSKCKPTVQEVESELASLYPTHDVNRAAFVILAAWSNPSMGYTRLLAPFLADKEWQGIHEVVIDLLSALRDPNAQDILVQAISYRWSFDPGLQIPIKALQGIAEIDTPASMQALKEVARTNPDEAIRNEAEMLLQGGSE